MNILCELFIVEEFGKHNSSVLFTFLELHTVLQLFSYLSSATVDFVFFQCFGMLLEIIFVNIWDYNRPSLLEFIKRDEVQCNLLKFKGKSMYISDSR